MNEIEALRIDLLKIASNLPVNYYSALILIEQARVLEEYVTGQDCETECDTSQVEQFVDDGLPYIGSRHEQLIKKWGPVLNGDNNYVNFELQPAEEKDANQLSVNDVAALCGPAHKLNNDLLKSSFLGIKNPLHIHLPKIDVSKLDYTLADYPIEDELQPLTQETTQLKDDLTQGEILSLWAPRVSWDTSDIDSPIRNDHNSIALVKQMDDDTKKIAQELIEEQRAKNQTKSVGIEIHPNQTPKSDELSETYINIAIGKVDPMAESIELESIKVDENQNLVDVYCGIHQPKESIDTNVTSISGIVEEDIFAKLPFGLSLHFPNIPDVNSNVVSKSEELLNKMKQYLTDEFGDDITLRKVIGPFDFAVKTEIVYKNQSTGIYIVKEALSYIVDNGGLNDIQFKELMDDCYKHPILEKYVNNKMKLFKQMITSK